MSSLHHAAVSAENRTGLLYPADLDLLTTDEGFAQKHAERYLKTAQEYLEFGSRDNARTTATEGLKVASMFPGHLPAKLQLQNFLRNMDAPVASNDDFPSLALSLGVPGVLPLPHFEKRDRR
jgi:hypothetical protein